MRGRGITPGAMQAGRRLAIAGGWLILILAALLAASPRPGMAQVGGPPTPTPAGEAAPPEAPDQVDVAPEARDEEIQARLAGILESTGWFVNPQVRVQNGVVFLEGETRTEDYKTWAGNLARNTQDVAAVVNQIELINPPVWDFSPALAGLEDLGRDMVRALPLIGLSLIILVIAWGTARLTVSATRASLRRRLRSPLLTNVSARGAGLAVFLMGLYVVFYVAGLTNLALTLIGGTGLLGLILGIAFRDITENFLASIFLSIQKPFRTGDLVEIDDVRGFVQAMTTRVTVLMTPDGNHVQIPNATVYKVKIRNYSSNPNRREDFGVGIGYVDSILTAQEVALKVLEEHPAVLKDPEPWVLVDSLGSATVNLRVYFWLDGSQYSWLKVKSSVIRLVKRAFQAAEISMPDEAREMIFPEGVSVRVIEGDGRQGEGGIREGQEEPVSVSTHAEGGLGSEMEEIQEQARQARTPEEGENLLNPREGAG